mmetsp:Transcript_21425/g.30017  ORF Transcript_21425/g.30017 Transcript_21425/m.30017 type:complete len:212 (-) Transcript_21425:720-1355(-)
MNPHKVISLLIYSQNYIGTAYVDFRMKNHIINQKNSLNNKINLFTTYKNLLCLPSLLFSISSMRKLAIIDTKCISRKAIKKICIALNCRGIFKNYIPGNFSNRQIKSFILPEAAIVAEPKNDPRIIKELSNINIPIIGICNTDTNISFIDWVLPSNTNSKFSNAMIFYLIGRLLKRYYILKRSNMKGLFFTCLIDKESKKDIKKIIKNFSN